MDGLEKQTRTIKELSMKLQVPRQHMIFLEENGMLDEFIDAKLEGDNLRAKWCLFDTAKPQIKRIE